MGEFVASGSIDPLWMCAIYVNDALGCMYHMINLAAAYTTQTSIFLRVPGCEESSRLVQPQFVDPESDHLTYLNAFTEYCNVVDEAKVDIVEWCEIHFLDSRRLDQAKETRDNLLDFVQSRPSELWYVPVNTNVSVYNMLT